MIVGFCDSTNTSSDENLMHFTPLRWPSSTLERVVRSTLSAEEHAISAMAESAIYARELFLGLPGKSEDRTSLPITVFTDNHSQTTTVTRTYARTSASTPAAEKPVYAISPVTIAHLTFRVLCAFAIW